MNTVERYRDASTHGKQYKTNILFDGIQYEVSVFFAPFTKGSKEYKHVVNKISTRKQRDDNGKLVTCLGTTGKRIKDDLDTVNTSLYVFVNEKGKATSDQATGSLQVKNWSAVIRGHKEGQVWICDLCRHNPDPAKKSAKSPVKPIMYIFEQLAHYLFGKTQIYLMVEKEKQHVLEPLYKNKYGFSTDSGFKLGDGDDSYIIMKKDITPDPEYTQFPFLNKKRKRTLKNLKH